MNTVLFVNASIGFSENLFLVSIVFGNVEITGNTLVVDRCFWNFCIVLYFSRLDMLFLFVCI